MQTAKVLVAVGGDAGNTVPKIVTAAEIPVLQGIHGDEAVRDIDPLDDVALNDNGKPRSNREELLRLRGIYGGARDGENHRIVDVIYPGAGARLPETIAELDLPEMFFKATSRATAKPVVEAPAEDAAPVKAVRKGKKADAEPAPEPAAAPADEVDEVKDMFA